MKDTVSQGIKNLILISSTGLGSGCFDQINTGKFIILVSQI